MSAIRRAARIELYVQPRASRTESTGLHDGVLRIRVAAPPVDDAANRALLEFVADRLGVSKRSVRIASGHASRHKVLEVEGVSAEVLAAALAPDR